MKQIKKQAVRKVTPKKAAAKPKKKLSKKDPDFYAKIGAISAAKRKLSPEFFSDMARKSHINRTEYHGGRKKKDA